MLNRLRRIRRELIFRITGDDPAQDFPLADTGRWRRLLKRYGQTLPRPSEAERPMRIYELEPRLREGLPLGLTPAGREGFVQWALAHSSGLHKVDVSELLALFQQLDALPDRGLEISYRLHPSWQEAVPEALDSTGGFAELKAYLAERYALRTRWFREAALRSREAKPRRGINVVAHFEYPSGLQRAALDLVEALKCRGIPVSLRDLPVGFRSVSTAPRILGLEEFDTTIVVAAVNTFPNEWFPKAGLRLRSGVKRIAVWYWEMEDLLPEWVPQLSWADEVWAPTKFLAETFHKYVNVPVIPMRPGVELEEFKTLPRSHFELPADKFLFLFCFDMHSAMGRKNPLGLIEAFRKAFRRDEPVELAIKVSRGESSPTELAELQSSCEAAGVRLLNRVMPYPELLALMNNADAYASLHRSEGLGLGLIEAMLLGKPTLATGYSGNLDFMTEANSYLVRAGRVACGVDAFPYRAGFVWGDPDLDHAAEQLRRVFDHQAEAKAKGERAKAEVGELLSMTAYAERVRAALS